MKYFEHSILSLSPLVILSYRIAYLQGCRISSRDNILDNFIKKEKLLSGKASYILCQRQLPLYTIFFKSFAIFILNFNSYFVNTISLYYKNNCKYYSSVCVLLCFMFHVTENFFKSLNKKNITSKCIEFFLLFCKPFFL